MLKKIIILAVSASALVFSSYYWGYSCGQRHTALASYDHLLLGLVNNILIHDAIESDKLESIRPVVKAELESDFARLIKFYKDYDFEDGEYTRCAISRRVRKMKQDGVILTNKQRLQGYPLQRVEDYLATACLGGPSHENWVIEDY